MNKSEMMKRMNIQGSFDTAYPHDWAVAMRNVDSRIDLEPYVWQYDPGDHWGRPFNVRAEYQKWCDAKENDLHWQEADMQMRYIVSENDIEFRVGYTLVPMPVYHDGDTKTEGGYICELLHAEVVIGGNGVVVTHKLNDYQKRCIELAILEDID